MLIIYEDEISHMLKITKPKLIFCDEDNLDIVSKSLCAIKLKCKICVFSDDKFKGTIPILDLFQRTGYELDFMYMCFF